MASPSPPGGADGDSGVEGATHEAGGRDSGRAPLPAHQLLDAGKLTWDESGAPLGRGSFGTVYRAEYTFVAVGTRPVALKVLHGVDPDAGLKELCVVAGLENPHVVQLFGGLEARGGLGIVMELLGDTLKEAVYVPGPVLPEGWEERRRWLAEVATVRPLRTPLAHTPALTAP